MTEDYKARCLDCGTVMGRHDEQHEDSMGNLLCGDCVQDYVFCAECGVASHIDYSEDIEGDYYCRECVRRISAECDGCGYRFLNSNMTYDSGDMGLCPSCLDIHDRCESCDRFVHHTRSREVSNRLICPECEEEVENSDIIHEASFKPTPRFRPYAMQGALFMGVEVEVDESDYRGNSTRHADAQTLIDEFSDIYIKNDGSLQHGFEIVTHPMTLAYHMNDFEWKRLCSMVIKMDYRSHKTSTCGLHVHMSRDAFTEASIMKLLFMVERFWDEWKKFSRRSADSLIRWASSYGVSSSPEDVYETAKRVSSKYKAVNLLNRTTIEIRIFKGTLKYQTILATLQMCAHLHQLATTLTVEEVQQLTWQGLVQRIPEEYTQLLNYLAQRGLE